MLVNEALDTINATWADNVTRIITDASLSLSVLLLLLLLLLLLFSLCMNTEHKGRLIHSFVVDRSHLFLSTSFRSISVSEINITKMGKQIARTNNDCPFNQTTTNTCEYILWFILHFAQGKLEWADISCPVPCTKLNKGHHSLLMEL